MEQRISEVLRSIGLNKAEVEVYLDLLKYGSSSALHISKRTNLYRSNTYDSLRRLIEKGIVKETIEDNKRTFTASDPEKIVDYIKQKEQDVKELLPHFKEFSKTNYEENKTFLSHGPFSLREALRELLSVGQPITVFAMSSNIEIFGEGFMEEFHKERIKKKIPLRMIYYHPTPRMQELNEMPYTDVKYINCEKDYNTARIVCGDKVYLLVFEKPYTSIEIRSKELAETFDGLFNFFWQYAEKTVPRAVLNAKATASV